MTEEFQESDVIWPDLHYRSSRCNDFQGARDKEDDCSYGGEETRLRRKNNKVKKKQQQDKTSSLPVNIPEKVAEGSWFHCLDWDDDDDEDDNVEMVPPHLMVARRIAGEMTFSVCTGNGRTLKGRDLSQVRNSILRMTGFLES